MIDRNERPKNLLQAWLLRHLEPRQRDWLDEALQRIAGPLGEKHLYVALGSVPRHLSKGDLRLNADDLRRADAARADWDPRHLSVDQAARILFLITAADCTPERFETQLDRICTTADVGELVAIYKGLPLYPNSRRLRRRSEEGTRTNMRAVFEAVAHANPFPRENFDELHWNHMVLKALFIGSSLHPIQGLDERANPKLAEMLIDFAHERWAAGRPISPELWRCVGPFAQGVVLADMAKALDMGEAGGATGAALALHARSDPAAQDALASRFELTAAIERGELSWARLAAHAT